MKIADTWLTPANSACAPATSTNYQKVSWDLRPEQSRFAATHLVRYWHKADSTIAVNHVRFRG